MIILFFFLEIYLIIGELFFIESLVMKFSIIDWVLEDVFNNVVVMIIRNIDILEVKLNFLFGVIVICF